jgi:hypothetical protein
MHVYAHYNLRASKNMLPPASSAGSKQSSACDLLLAGFVLGLFFNPEGGGDMFLQVSIDFPEARTLHNHH